MFKNYTHLGRLGGSVSETSTFDSGHDLLLSGRLNLWSHPVAPGLLFFKQKRKMYISVDADTIPLHLICKTSLCQKPRSALFSHSQDPLAVPDLQRQTRQRKRERDQTWKVTQDVPGERLLRRE